MTIAATPPALSPREIVRREEALNGPPLIVSSTIYLRIFATASIIWFHTPAAPLKILAAPGMAVFLCLSLMHAAQPQSIWPSFIRLTRRILFVWIVWWLFYAAVRLWMHRHSGGAWPDHWNFLTPLFWPAVHLWYLPFIYVAFIAAQLAAMTVATLRPLSKVVIFAVAGSGLALAKPIILELIPGLGQLAMALPALGFGVAFGYCLRLPREKRLNAYAAVAAIMILTGWYVFSSGNRIEGMAFIGGGPAMMLCMVPVPRSQPAMRLASLTLGIFLIHPFAMLVLWKFLGGSSPFWVIFPATILISTCVIWCMKQLPLTRAVV